jgi:signal transduction histidine kinase
MNRFDRVLVIRHVALAVGSITAWFLRQELEIGYTALWILGISSWLNFGAYFFRTRESLTQICLVASPIIGIGSWGALCAVTNGVESPFVTGLGLEIILSAMALSPTWIVLVTVGAVATLWIQQLFPGFDGNVVPLLLNSGFLMGMGGAMFLVNRRWQLTHDMLSASHDDLGDRLEALERQLEDRRALSSLGEGAARLAHGHKNAVHSLRGFLSLIEPKLKGSEAVLSGLRMAIDDLEQLAYLTLNQGEPAQPADPSLCYPVAEIERVLSEVSMSLPGVTWKTSTSGPDPALRISSGDFVEVIRALLTNAVEAMDGTGEGRVETHSNATRFHCAIHDQGPGLEAAEIERIFERAYTTKPRGSGYGLYLARTFVEGEGGTLTARPARPRGMVFELSLPIDGSETS